MKLCILKVGCLIPIFFVAMIMNGCGDDETTGPDPNATARYSIILNNDQSLPIGGLVLAIEDPDKRINTSTIENSISRRHYVVLEYEQSGNPAIWTFGILVKRGSLTGGEIVNFETRGELSGDITIVEACDTLGTALSIHEFELKLMKE